MALTAIETGDRMYNIVTSDAPAVDKVIGVADEAVGFVENIANKAQNCFAAAKTTCEIVYADKPVVKAITTTLYDVASVAVDIGKSIVEAPAKIVKGVASFFKKLFGG